MSDHYGTQLNHRIKILYQVRELFYWCRHGKWDFYEWVNKRNEMVYQHNSWIRLTGYNKEYVQGYMDRMSEELDREFEWRVFVPDLGHVNSRTSEGREKMKGHWSECIGDLGCNFWPGTDKLWFAGNKELQEDVVTMYANEREHWDEIVAKYIEKDRLHKLEITARAFGEVE